MAKKKTEVTNDQAEIIKAIKNKNYFSAWEKIKYVGYKTVPDMRERLIIFYDIVKDFDYDKNNNFIQFYKTRLDYYIADKNETFVMTRNRKIIHGLKSEDISPSESTNSPTINELRNWNL